MHNSSSSQNNSRPSTPEPYSLRMVSTSIQPNAPIRGNDGTFHESPTPYTTVPPVAQPSTPRGPENQIPAPDPFARQDAPMRNDLMARPNQTQAQQQGIQEYFANRARNLNIEKQDKGGRG